jgi:hypothetical protein
MHAGICAGILLVEFAASRPVDGDVVLAQLISRSFLLEQARALHAALGRSELAASLSSFPRLTKADVEAARADLQAAIERVGKEPAEDQDDRAFMPRDPLLGLVQTSLTEVYRQKRPELIRKGSAGSRLNESPIAVTDEELVGVASSKEDAKRLFGEMEPADAGWAACLVAMAWTKRNGRREFKVSPADPVLIANDARVVLMGDWASGLPRARKLAARVREELDQAAGRECHVIHLGDTYYSGWPEEYNERFLPYWPVRISEQPKIGSWSLNANHDMYSGGHGYFDTLLADSRFVAQQQSSFFSLENDHWQLLGLDTAYTAHELHGEQATWVSRSREATPTKKGVLLSHHQPFSAFEPGGEVLLSSLAPVLNAGAIRAWFWGHEHRCALYRPAHGIEYPRCIGHAGIPVYASRNPAPAGVTYLYEGALDEGFEHWALFGFAVLDFDDDGIRVRYVNEDGVEHYAESIG